LSVAKICVAISEGLPEQLARLSLHVL
jgi:hypothetical protein